MTSQNTLSLWNCWGSSDKPRAGWPGKLSHEVAWVVLGEANPVLPDQQNPVSQALGARVFILFTGVGLLLVIDCACMSHELLKHMDQYSWLNWPWVPIWSIPKVPTDDASGLKGTNGMGRPCWLEFLWHPPLDPVDHPCMALFMDKNITWQKCIMNSVKYNCKRYKIWDTRHNGIKTINMHILRSVIWQWSRLVGTT